MKSISGKKFAKLLESKGWISLRVNGSNHIYGKSGIIRRVQLFVGLKRKIPSEKIKIRFSNGNYV